MRKNICGRHCSPELSFYRFSLTPAGRRTPAMPGTPIPYVPSSPGDLRRRASVGRQSVSCFHTQPVGDTHGSLFTPTSPTLRAAVPVLRPVPRLPPACFYNAIFPFITKIVRLGRFTFYCFHQCRCTAGHPRLPPAYFYNAIFPFITMIVRLGRFTFLLFSSTQAHRRTPAKPGTPTPYVPFQSGRPPAQGERGPAECVMLPHTACR